MRHGVEEARGESLKRLLFNLLAGMSLLLCVATATIWIRSAKKIETVSYQWTGKSDGYAYWLFSARSQEGSIRLTARSRAKILSEHPEFFHVPPRFAFSTMDNPSSGITPFFFYDSSAYANYKMVGIPDR